MEGETLPKSPIHRLTKEFSTKQNLEWNIGGVNGDRAGLKKKKKKARPYSLSTHLFSVFGPWVHVPLVQVLFAESVFTESDVQFCKYGTWQCA